MWYVRSRRGAALPSVCVTLTFPAIVAYSAYFVVLLNMLNLDVGRRRIDASSLIS